MIVNHDRKFVFVCVPKTGSTTLSKYFKRSGEFDKPKGHAWLMEKYHYPISKIQKDEDVEGYYKFAYHRNPFDRLVSSWIDFSQDKAHLRTWSENLAKQFKSWEDFSKNFVNTEWANEIHFQPTTYYTHVDGVQAVDHIARYENFSEETQNIFKTVGINYRSEDFNHRFRKTNRDKDYRKYYKDDKTIENVSKHFSKDLETFGDKF